jgi:ABC-type tungstate transport system permease subunit
VRKLMRNWLLLGIACLLCACATSPNRGGSQFILLSSTIGPIDAGIVDALETAFEKDSGIKPSGSWYQVFEKGSTGNVPTLQYTDQKAAYTVIDRATYLTLKDKIKLVVLVEKDEALLNFISLIPVSPQKFPKVNYQDAMIFVKRLTSPDKGQKIIRDFGKDKYGSPLFFPNSKEWRQAQGGKS